MKKGKKIAALFLSIVLLGCCACNKQIQISTGFEKNEIFKIADESEDIRNMLLLLVNEKNEYEKSLGSDIWQKNFDGISLEEEVKEKIKKQMVELNVIYHMAKENEVSLTGEETKKLEDAAAEYLSQVSDEEKEKLNLSETQVSRFYEKMYLSDKYYEQKTSENEREISDEDARVIEVTYLFFQLGEKDIQGNVIPYEEERQEEIKQKAEEALSKADAGNDFGALVQEYSDDEEGRISFGRGTMEENFEETAFALKEGEHSGLVKTEEGIYIIKCVNDYLPEETQENKENLKERYKAESFKEIYEPYLEKLTLQFHTKVWDEVKISDYDGCGAVSVFSVYEQYFQ